LAPAALLAVPVTLAPVKPEQPPPTPSIVSAQEITVGSIIKDCADCPEMVMIPAGSFEMGSAESGNEKPVHQVKLSALLLGRTEVTQGQWQAVMGSNPSDFKQCGADCPVEKVSWNDAQEFAKKLSAKTGKTYRLPSESEWEFAARAGSSGLWSFGDEESQLAAHAWYGRPDFPLLGGSGGNSDRKTHAVAQKKPNAFGLYDMHGNVWEWVEDAYHENYQGAPADGSAWISGGDQARRGLRGGAYVGLPKTLASTYRNRSAPHNANSQFGFRIARTL
jgi:formylglycine-generating enzyme required for sulfatase activity